VCEPARNVCYGDGCMCTWSATQFSICQKQEACSQPPQLTTADILTSLHFTYMGRVNRAPTEGANRLMGQNHFQRQKSLREHPKRDLPWPQKTLTQNRCRFCLIPLKFLLSNIAVGKFLPTCTSHEMCGRRASFLGGFQAVGRDAEPGLDRLHNHLRTPNNITPDFHQIVCCCHLATSSLFRLKPTHGTD
jgi:hypothetical protein